MKDPWTFTCRQIPLIILSEFHNFGRKQINIFHIIILSEILLTEFFSPFITGKYPFKDSRRQRYMKFSYWFQAKVAGKDIWKYFICFRQKLLNSERMIRGICLQVKACRILSWNFGKNDRLRSICIQLKACLIRSKIIWKNEKGYLVQLQANFDKLRYDLSGTCMEAKQFRNFWQPYCLPGGL